MNTLAVVLNEPGQLHVREVDLSGPGAGDVMVDVEWSGVSTGTERLLYTGKMPPFPGMGYPLVPGYECVGRVVDAGEESGRSVGERVFVPGARCFNDVQCLFGGAASRVVSPGDRVVPVDERLGDSATLLALAATAHHAIHAEGARSPDLIVGHGVLGRLLARLATIRGGKAPTVWERDPDRAIGAAGYKVIHPDDDKRTNYRAIYDASGDPDLLDALIERLSPRGEVTLAGFYERPLSFAFPPAFMREARIRVAAEWKPEDLEKVNGLVSSGRLSLGDLITHRQTAADAPDAYQTAFSDPSCLKMVLDWREVS